MRRDGATGASGRAWRRLVFLEAIFFPLVKQVRLGAAQVDDLWTAVSLQSRGRDGGMAGRPAGVSRRGRQRRHRRWRQAAAAAS